MRINIMGGGELLGSVRSLQIGANPLTRRTVVARLSQLYMEFHKDRANRNDNDKFIPFLVETGEFEGLETTDEIVWSM